MKITPDSDLAKFIPYSTHVHPNVVKTVGADYMMTWLLAGIPFVGRNPEELSQKHSTFNKLLQTIRAPDYVNVAFWSHDLRRQIDVTLQSTFKTAFNTKVNSEYFAEINKKEVFINEMYLTVLYRPENKLRTGGKTVDAVREIENTCVTSILDLGRNIQSTLDEYSPQCLGTYESPDGVVFSRLLEFYAYLINHELKPVPVLPARVFNYLGASSHIFNSKTGSFLIKNSTKSVYGSILSIKEYPDYTAPGVLNNLKYLNCEYVITQSFSPISRGDALTLVERLRTRMLATKDKAVSQIQQLDDALDGIASSSFIMGDFHFTVAVFGKTVSEISDFIPDIRSVLSSAGIVSVKEQLAVMAGFYAQFPGNFQYRSRKALLSSLNYLGFNPFHNFSTGKKENNPWGQALTVLQATNGQPYFFNFHATRSYEFSFGEKALANTIIIGKSGTGKTALINFLLSQVQKYDPPPTIFFFDKDRGAEIFVRASAGRYMAIEAGLPTGFNPLQCENTPGNIQYVCGLVKLLAAKNSYSPSEDEDVLRAVRSIMDTPTKLRTFTNLRTCFPNLGDDSIYSRLKKWTNEGSLGWVFDNPQDLIDFENSTVIGFDYTDLIDMPEIRVAVISYLIKRMEELIDGRRFIYVMDEFWKILEGEGGLKEFAKNKLKTIRKQNGLGIFATQSPEDALKSDISATLVEQAATLILLPNPNASEDDYVNGLKLTQAEYQAVKSLDERNRIFMVKQGHDSAVCQLKLGALPEVLSVLSASTDNVKILDNILKRYTTSDSRFANINPDLWLNDFFTEFKGYRAVSVSFTNK
jgi:type IV secretion system protein VirB4